MTRRVALSLIAAVVLVMLAAAATWQSRRDDERSSEVLTSSWRDIGARLVNPRLAGASIQADLTCFAYRVNVHLDRDVLCFDVNGRLVELLRETRHAVMLVSIHTAGDRSEVRVPADAMSAALRVGMEVRALESSVSLIRTSFIPCRDAVTRAQNWDGSSVAALREDYAQTVTQCAAAAGSIGLVAGGAGGYPTLLTEAGRVAGLLGAMATTAHGYLGKPMAPSPALERSLARPFLTSLLASRRRVYGELASLARSAGAERHRLTGG